LTPENLKFKEGQILFAEEEKCCDTFLILSGKIRLSRRMGEMSVPYSILGPGDIIGNESFDSKELVDYSAKSLTDSEILPLPKELLLDMKNNLPNWLVPWIEDYINRYHISQRPTRSNIATLYSICNLFMVFLNYEEVNGNERNVLKGKSKPVLDEVRKNRSSTRYLVEPVMNGLSHVGLLDFQTYNPSNPLVIISDKQLYQGFLIFLQNAADLEAGIRENVFVFSPLNISRASERILDGILMDEDLAERLFIPDRSMVHISMTRLKSIYENAGGLKNIMEFEGGLKELEKHGTFNRVTDNERQSFFLNMRNLLRLNIRRNPAENFIDILEFLLEEMYQARYSPKIMEHNELW